MRGVCVRGSHLFHVPVRSQRSLCSQTLQDVNNMHLLIFFRYSIYFLYMCISVTLWYTCKLTIVNIVMYISLSHPFFILFPLPSLPSFSLSPLFFLVLSPLSPTVQLVAWVLSHQSRDDHVEEHHLVLKMNFALSGSTRVANHNKTHNAACS